MNDPCKTLAEAKERVRSDYLGSHGIHGVGVKQSKNAVRIYAEEMSEHLREIIQKIEKECSPFVVDVVVEGKPTLHVGNE